MKYQEKVKLLFVLSIILSATFARGQVSESINFSDIIETVKLNTDRDLYISGDELYFTADYFINNKKSFPVLSKVLYVELINCIDNTALIQKKINIIDNNANGFMNIPNNIVSGNYILRAYTQYQRNFSKYSYSYHFITILNPNNNQNPLIYYSKSDSINIVPESNILLKGVKNKVVFRIPSHFNNKDYNYFIADKNFSILKEINIHENGFAKEELVFDNLDEHYMMIQTETGDSMFRAFPKVKTKGFLTSVRKSEKNTIYTIRGKGVSNTELPFKVSVFSGDFRSLYTENVKIKDELTSLYFKNETFESGINYIILFNAEGGIEKINSMYFRPLSNNKIEINIDNDIFSAGDSINAFLVMDDNGEPLEDVSISVSLNGTKKDDHNFIPDLYLSNSLILQNYLENNEKIGEDLLSQIMILFDKEIDKEVFLNEIHKAGNPVLDYIPEIRGVTISGELRDKNSKELIRNQNVYLSVLFNNPQFHAYRTKEDGKFIFSLNKLEGINDVFLCTERDVKGDNEYEITINNSFSANNPTFGLLPTFIDENNKALVRELYINSQIQQRTYQEQIQNKHLRKNVDAFNINGNIVTTYIEDYIKLKNMEELFFEIFPFVKYKKIGDNYDFSIYGENGYLLPGEPLILVDKIPVLDPNKIRELDITKIEKVEVINKTYYLGSHTFNGIIMLTTNTNDFAGIKPPESSVFFEYPAIDKLGNPTKYIVNQKKVTNKSPDFRTVLYWNPDLKLTGKKQAFSFKASDKKGVYDIIVKSYNSNGERYYGSKQITIN